MPPSIRPSTTLKRLARSSRLPRPLRRNTTSAPAAPGALPLVGHVGPFAKDPFGFFESARAAVGDVFRVQLLDGEKTFLLNALDLPAYYKNGDMAFEEIGAVMGGRVFGYSYESAAKAGIDEITQLINNDLKGAPLQIASERMQRLLEAELAEIPAGEWHEDGLFAWCSKHVFRASTNALFGDGVYSETLKELYDVLDKSFGVLAMGTPPALIRGAHQAQASLGDALVRIGDGHAVLIDHRRELFSDRDIEDAIWPRFESALLWAANANTVSAAFWTIFHVLRDERAAAAILDEVRSVRGGRGLGDAPYAKHELRAMSLLESAISEMNRLTTAPLSPRRAHRATSLPLHDGRELRIDEGADLAIWAPAVHFDPEIYDDPHTFRFDRFAPDESGRLPVFEKRGQKVRFNLLPFGGGRSMCPGRFFAINEFKIVISVLLSHFDIELLDREAPDFDLTRTGFGTYSPTSDVRFRYRRRA